MTLVEAGVDFVVVDTAHGHSQGVLEMVARLKGTRPWTSSGATSPRRKRPTGAGRSQGGRGEGRCRAGSICTTAWSLVSESPGHGHPRGRIGVAAARLPVIADGGLQYSGDIAKAMVAGRRHRDAGVAAGRLRGVARGRGLRQRQAVQAVPGMGSLGAMQSRGRPSPTPRTGTSRTTCSATTNSCPKVSRVRCPIAANCRSLPIS